MCFHPVFHDSRLRPVPPGPLMQEQPPQTHPVPVEVKDTPAYRVNRLLDSRQKGGRLQYLASWVSDRDILSQELKDEFHWSWPEGTSSSRPLSRARPRPPRGPALQAGGTITFVRPPPCAERSESPSLLFLPLCPRSLFMLIALNCPCPFLFLYFSQLEP